MKPTVNILQTLLDEAKQITNPEEYLISMYIPGEKSASGNMRIIFKPLFEDLIHTRIHSKSPYNRYFDYIREIEQTIHGISEIAGGVAIFAKLDLSDHDLNTDKAKSTISVTAINLPEAPYPETYIGKVFQIAQLIRVLQYVYMGIAISFNRDDYCIYEFDEERIRQHSFVKASPQMEPGTGGGEYRAERKNELSVRDSIKEGILDIKKILSDRVSYLTVFSSAAFPPEEVKKYFDEEFSAGKLPECLYIPYIPASTEEILQESKKTIRTHKVKELQSTLTELFNQTHLFTDNLKEILASIYSHNVDSLFMNEGITISKEDINLEMFSAEEKQRMSSDGNILPYIISKVYEYGGKCIIVPQGLMQVPIILQMRYNPKKEFASEV